jgi:hypothetical protein
MSAEINWDFAVERHVATIRRIAHQQGREAADERVKELDFNDAFRRRVIDFMKGVDESGRPY